MRLRQAKKIFSGVRMATLKYKQSTLDKAACKTASHYAKCWAQRCGFFVARRKATPADLGGNTNFTVSVTWDGE